MGYGEDTVSGFFCPSDGYTLSVHRAREWRCPVCGGNLKSVVTHSTPLAGGGQEGALSLLAAEPREERSDPEGTAGREAKARPLVPAIRSTDPSEDSVSKSSYATEAGIRALREATLRSLGRRRI